jgi:hypothetical protein
MNVFASFVILYQKPLQDFLDASPEARLKEFGQLIGVYRMVGGAYPATCRGLTVVQALLNQILANRIQMMDSTMSSEPLVELGEREGIWVNDLLAPCDYYDQEMVCSSPLVEYTSARG